jgi:hypothetical protein
MPKIVFFEDKTLNVCRNQDSYYYREHPVYLDKHVKEGEVYAVEFLEGVHDPKKDCRLDVRFDDGTVAVGLPNWIFDLEEDYYGHDSN